ncbi:MAG: YaiO family outer membrane beta-barrel protein [Fibrobacteria bacterium]|nr:YaiO family outer membrane beta-barrel protein [Fibrobacteria bacterium]
MNPRSARLLILFAVAATVPSAEPWTLRVGGLAGIEALDLPDAPLWSHLGIGTLLSSGGYRAALANESVRRYDADDGETRLGLGGSWGPADLEIAASKGWGGPLLPVWRLGTTLTWSLAQGLTLDGAVGGAWYDSLETWNASIGVDHWVNKWHGRAEVLAPFARKEFLDFGGGLLLEYWWTDDASTGLRFTQTREAENIGRDRLAITDVSSVVLTGRKAIGTNRMRLDLSWIRHGSIHRRWGATLGIDHDFQL